MLGMSSQTDARQWHKLVFLLAVLIITQSGCVTKNAWQAAIARDFQDCSLVAMPGSDEVPSFSLICREISEIGKTRYYHFGVEPVSDQAYAASVFPEFPIRSKLQQYKKKPEIVVLKPIFPPKRLSADDLKKFQGYYVHSMFVRSEDIELPRNGYRLLKVGKPVQLVTERRKDAAEDQSLRPAREHPIEYEAYHVVAVPFPIRRMQERRKEHIVEAIFATPFTVIYDAIVAPVQFTYVTAVLSIVGARDYIRQSIRKKETCINNIVANWTFD